MYDVRVLDAAMRDMEALDKQVAFRVVDRIRWLGAHFEALTPRPLTGDLVGLYGFRVGDYRIFYQVIPEERTIVIHQVGHRRDVYRSR